MPTVGVMVTVLITCAEGLLHPIAVTCILTEPEYPLAQVITPVEAFIEPAATLLKDQLNPELFVAEVPYEVVVVALINWQVGSDPAETVMAVGKPTVGVMVTVLIT